MLKDKVKEIIDLVESSDVHEVEVSAWWGRKIRVTKSFTHAGPAFVSIPPGGPPQAVEPANPSSQVTAAVQSPPGTAEQEIAANTYQILSPIVGTFYRAPSPEAPPFINPGDRIRKGQIICIIEAMKIMNEIESDVDGTVIEILIENGTPVEYNHPLVMVEKR